MQVIESDADGLRRSYLITLPAGHIVGLRDQRLAEIARTVPISGYRRGEAPPAAVLQRFGASVLGEVLEQEAAAALRHLLADRALRPAQAPRVEVGTFAEDADLEIRVTLEELPEVALPDLGGVRLERLSARPAAAHVDRAMERLALRHGTVEDVAPRPAGAGDVLLCDIEGRLPVDLLANGLGRGARAGQPGMPPTDWAIDVSPGLTFAITAAGMENGLPCLDVALRGTTGAGAFLRIFATKPSGLAVTAGTVMTLCMRARLLAGILPEGTDVRLGFNERSDSAFLSSPRRPAALGEAEMRAAVPMTTDATLAYARPVLDLAFKAGLAADFTLRVGPARVFAGAEEPEALHFGGGSMPDQMVEVGAPVILPGFSAQLEGLSPGETRFVEGMLPANHPVSELANRRVRFAVTAKALRQRRPRAQDDTLAQAVGLADVAALRAAVLRSLQREYDTISRLRLKSALLEVLAGSVDFPVPQCLLASEFEQVRQRMEAELAGQGAAEPAGADDDRRRAEYLGIAERRIRLRLVLAEIARAHALDVSEEEVARAMRQDAARYPGQERQVLEFYRANAQALDALRAPLLEEKVVDLLLAGAEISEREVTPEELGAA